MSGYAYDSIASVGSGVRDDRYSAPYSYSPPPPAGSVSSPYLSALQVNGSFNNLRDRHDPDMDADSGSELTIDESSSPHPTIGEKSGSGSVADRENSPPTSANSSLIQLSSSSPDKILMHGPDISRMQDAGSSGPFQFTATQVSCLCEALLQERNINRLNHLLMSLPREMQNGSESVIRAKVFALFAKDALNDMYKLIESYEFSNR